jgi:hypothetical protein
MDLWSLGCFLHYDDHDYYTCSILEWNNVEYI